MKTEDYLVCFYIVTLIIVIVYIQANKDYCETCQMFNTNITWGINGIYHNPNYYCIWTNGRLIEEINKTIIHEECHHLIEHDKDNHFCKEE